MAQTILLKRSAVPGKVPTTSDVPLGSLALNTYDGKLYTKTDQSGTEAIVDLTAGGGGGGGNLPQNSQTSAYVLSADDAGKHVSITVNGVTVPASTLEVGDVTTIYNNSTGNITITQGTSVTLRFAGSTSTGNRTLARYGLCSILCVASNVFVISGVGLS